MPDILENRHRIAQIKYLLKTVLIDRKSVV